MYQQLILIGRLGEDPVLRRTQSGTPVTGFSLAVNKTWNDQHGQRQEKTTWFRISTWNKQAEVAEKNLRKGSRVMVVGEVEEARPYTDRDGNQRASLEVTAQTIKFLSDTAPGEPLKTYDPENPTGVGYDLSF